MSFKDIPIPASILPPRDSYRFWPPSSYCFHGSGKKLVRHIFEQQVLSSFENEKLCRLESEIKEGKIEGYSIPPDWSRNHLLRFCYGTGWKTRNSVKALVAYLKWYYERIPLGWQSLYPKVYSILNSGTFYICGRDCMYRPLIVLDFNKIDFKSNAIDLYADLLCFLLEYVLQYMLVPGQVENWVVLIDLGKKGLGSLSINSLKQVLSILQVNYRCRMGMTYIVNPPKSMFMLWSCIKPFLDEILIEKIKISNGSTSAEMLSSFNPGQVEEKYGGKMKNLQAFWPPTVNECKFDSPGGGIVLGHKDSFHLFEHLRKEQLQESSFEEGFKGKAKSRSESLELSIEQSDIEVEELDDQIFSRSDAEENVEPLAELENSVFFDCKAGKSGENSFKCENFEIVEGRGSGKKPLKEKIFNNKDNLSPYKAGVLDSDFETPKKKGPRPIGIILENDDKLKRCSSFGCCESDNYSCGVF